MSGAVSKRPILIVDDEPEMLFSLRGLLRREFEVFTATSGQEGIDIMQGNEIHIVMTDQRMPEMTGVEFLAKVKCSHPGAVRLIFTGYAEIKAVINAINHSNVFRYVTKPWDPETLLKVLREAGEQYDQIVDRTKLQEDLRALEGRAIDLEKGLRDGRFGTLNEAGLLAAAELVDAGQKMLDRLDRVLAPAQRPPLETK